MEPDSESEVMAETIHDLADELPAAGTILAYHQILDFLLIERNRHCYEAITEEKL